MNSFNLEESRFGVPGITQRNEFFDLLFYDTDALTEVERASLSPLTQREGSIVVVGPGDSGQAIDSFVDFEQFTRSRHASIQAVALAGVGSSVLGTAALARNVADAFDMPVAGIVSGYGVSDLMLEAMGGWFFYGAIDVYRHELRDMLDQWDDVRKSFAKSMLLSKPVKQDQIRPPRITDVRTLLAMLSTPDSKIRLLVGHSKGSLLADFALERFNSDLKGKGHRYHDLLNIVSLGAVAAFPPEFQRLHQFIGEIDWFGGLNSRMDVPHISVPGAWHHLNTQFPYHLPVVSLLREQVKLD